MINQLLADVCEINGYKSITDVSDAHPPTSSGRPVTWLEIVATADAFRMVNDDDPSIVTRVNFDDDIRTLYPARPSDLDGSLTAAELAFMVGTLVLATAHRKAMGNWDGVG